MGDPIAYDVRGADYLDEGAVEKELRRVFDICHTCRRCLPLCPSFPDLFQRIDSSKTEEVDGLSKTDLRQVVDLCYQCKLCYNHCPYHPPHRWMLDFPRLMLRAKASRASKEGVTLQDRVLGMVDTLGRMGSFFAPFVNWLNDFRINRIAMEKVLGIHRDRNLPRYRSRFSSWFRRRHSQGNTTAPDGAKVALFATCSVEYNETGIGKDCVAVLERNGIDVSLPAQRCCGMPLLDGGDIDGAMRLARANVASLSRAVDEGRDIVVPGPTCSFTIRNEWPHMLGTEESKRVAANTYDISEYLMKRHREGLLDTDFEKQMGKVAYHLPCHLKAQNIGFRSRDLLKLIPGTEVIMTEGCSGVDGTWGFKKEYFELSLNVAKGITGPIDAANPDSVASDCPLACLQIKKVRGGNPEHPIRILRKAYGEEPSS